MAVTKDEVVVAVIEVPGWRGKYAKWIGMPVHETICIVCGKCLESLAFDFGSQVGEYEPREPAEMHSGWCQIEFNGMLSIEREKARDRYSDKGRFEAFMEEIEQEKALDGLAELIEE